jgi:hypothetical protein
MKRAPIIVIVVLAVLVVGLGTWLLVRLFSAPPPTVTSYAECVAAGYPILETYPEQCRTPDGTTFTNPDAPPQTPEPTPSGQFTSEGGVAITLDDWSDSPVASPLTLTGEVPGSWSFEASFLVLVTDESGTVLGDGIAQIEVDWMTDELVPFGVTVAFDPPVDGTAGYLVLVKANASGLPEHDDFVSIPITFA